ncbi:MAG: TIGR02270 family protein [Alphaproteobacteria bacterium]
MIVEPIVSQHSEESAFLWLLRDYATKEPHYSVADLDDLEERINAHLDGLRIAGNQAWRFCEAGLQYEEPGEVFTAAYTALDNCRQDWLEQTLEVSAKAPESIRGFVSALGWLPKQKLQGHVVNWLKSDQSPHRQIGLAACAIQRVDCGNHLMRGLHDSDPCVSARALRCIGEIRRRDLLAPVIEQLNAEDTSCRHWAAWSATLLGDKMGLETLQTFFHPECEFQHRALTLGLRAMDKSAAVSWIREQTGHPGYERTIIEATGIIGDPAAIPWLISKMDKPEYSRLAAESLAMITGVDIAYEDLDIDQPEGFEAGPSEYPEDEEVAMDPDEELPWPDQQRVAEWWSGNQDKFAIGERYLSGYTITRDHCREVLKYGYQRQRRAAAIELALLNKDEPLFNCSATAKHQLRLLGEA